MTPKRRTPQSRGEPTKPRPASERRRNAQLREVLDELIAFVRQLSRTLHQMSPAELQYAQQRMEWLADELWRLVAEREP